MHHFLVHFGFSGFLRVVPNTSVLSFRGFHSVRTCSVSCVLDCVVPVTCQLSVLVETVIYVHPVLCLYLNSSEPSYERFFFFFIHLTLHTTPSSITLERPTHPSGELSAALFYTLSKAT